MSYKESTSLSDIRVLEIAGDVGGYAGKLYADLGADVVHLELPEGDPVRKLPPFLHGKSGLETSLTYIFQNTNKRGIVLDFRALEGKKLFLELVRSSDILLESLPPGTLEKLGLGYHDIQKVNRKLVHVSITPFGQNGPYRNMKGSDLVALATGGMLYLAGTGDEKPARAYGEQAYIMGSLYAAIGSMIALYNAEMTEEGQYIDISLQECVSTALETSAEYWDLQRLIRRGSGDVEAGRGTFQCKDGEVFIMAAMGNNTFLWDNFVEWLIEDGIEGAEELQKEEWKDPQFRTKPEARENFKEIFCKFSIKYDKLYLYEESQRKKCICYPVNNPSDVYNNPQLKQRNFFKSLLHPNMGEVVFPGPCYELEKIPWKLCNPAPKFGQHTSEILKEMGFSEADITMQV